MLVDVGSDDVPFEQRLRDARRMLDSPPASAPMGEGVELRGEGEAADGRVRAVAVTGGRVESLELDPRVMRMSSQELAGHLTVALNGALDAVRAQVPVEQVDVVPDSAVLMERLREVQNAGLRQLDVITRGINDALAGIRDRAYVSGDTGFQGLEHLLDQAQESVGPASAEHVEEGSAGGEGEAAGGQVRVVVNGSGRVEAIELGGRAMRSASHELAGQVVSAANAALEDARARAAERVKALGEGVSERVREIQDQSVQQLGSYVRSLAALMNSIEKR